MTTLSKDEVIAWAMQSGLDEHLWLAEIHPDFDNKMLRFFKFAHLCRADLVAEIAENDALRDRLSELLTGTANALKGDPGEDRLNDWSDLPKVAGDLVAENKRLSLQVKMQSKPMLDAMELFAENAALKADAKRYRFLSPDSDYAVCEWVDADESSNWGWFAITESKLDEAMKRGEA